ncbi:MAG: hypothetical protein ACC700_18195 [Anaerolineales bacterium]
MKSSDPIALSTNYRLSLVLLSLFGTVFVLLSTIRYGAGLSPDSVTYIGAARNMIAGVGIISYNGAPLVAQAPLYPALLALVGKIIGADPLLFAHIVNALLFGLIVYLGGLLTFKYLSSSPFTALMGTLAIVFSIPLFHVSGWAWSEPLFISFVLLSLIFAHSYLEKDDVTSLMLFSSSVALSSLTRYIGVTLIFWGALIILIFQRDSPKNRIAHLALFTLISALPIGLWLIRNYAISSTLFGPRASSTFTFFQNLAFVFNGLLYWYIPRRIAEHRIIMAVVGGGVSLYIGLSLRGSWQGMKVRLRQINPVILFALIYTTFLVITSTTTAYDQINNRLLSPIYVPLTLLLLISAQALVDPYQRRFSKKIVNTILLIGITVWLVYPIRSTILNAVNLISNGQGYSGRAWTESETVQYLLQHRTSESECTFYTNGPDAAYLLADLATKRSPNSRTSTNSPEVVNDIDNLRGVWPDQSNACLIWFDKIGRKYLFTIDELRAIANIDLIALLEDGAIYSIARE